jgi:ParB-like chromosome segregation protein Spo0J
MVAEPSKTIKLSDIKFKEEYRNVIRPLSTAEREHLKHNISKHGAKVPIDLNIKYVVDGHHRTELCKELGLESIPATIHDFSRESLTEWQFIYAVNVPGRHLADYEKVELACKLSNYETEREEAKKRQINNLVSKDTKNYDKKGRMRELLAAETGVSPATAARCLKIIKKLRSL